MKKVEATSVTPSELGSLMKKVRLALSIRQTELAECLGVDQTTLSRYEAGKSTPSAIEWLNFCTYAGISPNMPLVLKQYTQLKKLSPT